jgi:hypothetical protein
MFSTYGAIPYHCEEWNNYFIRTKDPMWKILLLQIESCRRWCKNIVSEMVQEYRHIIIQRALAAAKVLGTELPWIMVSFDPVFWKGWCALYNEQENGALRWIPHPWLEESLVSCLFEGHSVNCFLNRLSRWILSSNSFIFRNFIVNLVTFWRSRMIMYSTNLWIMIKGSWPLPRKLLCDFRHGLYCSMTLIFVQVHPDFYVE